MAVTYHLFCFISSAILSYLISAARRGRGPRPSQFMRGKARSESGEAEAGDWVIANSKFQWSSVYWSQTQQTVHIMEQRIFWWRVKGSGVLICSPSNQIISTTCPPFSLPKVSISGWKLVLLFIFCWVFLHWHCYARKSNNRINDLDNEWDMISRNQRRAYLRWSTAAQVCPKSGKFPPEYHIIGPADDAARVRTNKWRAQRSKPGLQTSAALRIRVNFVYYFASSKYNTSIIKFCALFTKIVSAPHIFCL